MILAFQLEDHVVPVQSAERLAPAPLDSRHAEHGGLDHISLARQLVEQCREPCHSASVGLDMWCGCVIPGAYSVASPRLTSEHQPASSGRREINSTPCKAHLN